MRACQVKYFLIVVCLLATSVALARGQTRRRTPSTRKGALVVKYEPLTEKQKASIVEILNQGKLLEVTYLYDPSRYYDESSVMADNWGKITPTLPDGLVTTILSKMVSAYADAGYLYSIVFPHRETEPEKSRRRAIETIEKLQRTRGNVAENAETYEDRETRWRNAHIGSILQRYDIQNLSPYEARQRVFTIAQTGRQIVDAMLPKIPTARPKLQETEPSIAPSETLPVAPQPKSLVSAIVGSWLLEFTLSNNVNYKIPLTVQAENGAYKGVLGSTPNERQVDITVSEKTFSLTVPEMLIQSRVFSLTISGAVSDDSITGTFSMSGVSNDVKGLTYSAPLTGTRSR